MLETFTLWVLFLGAVWAKCMIAYVVIYSLWSIARDEGVAVSVLGSVVIIPIGFVLNLFANFILYLPMEELWGIEYASQLPMWLNVIIMWLPPSLMF